MKKKAQWWNVLGEPTLSFIVIVIVILGVIANPQITKAASKVFDAAKSLLPKEEDYKPWTPADLTPNEIKADASMRALQMAIDAMAGDKALLDVNRMKLPENIGVKYYKVTYYISYEQDRWYSGVLGTLDNDAEISKPFSMDAIKNYDQFWIHVIEPKNDQERENNKIREITEVHNIKLEVKYSDDKTCIIETKEKDDGLYSGQDLRTYESSVEYDKELDKNNDKVVDCQDSPTWLQCPNMRLYYCGKRGAGIFEEERTYWEKDGKSTAKVKSMIVFDKIFSKEEKPKDIVRDNLFNNIADGFNSGVDKIKDVNEEVPLAGDIFGVYLPKGTYKEPYANCYGGVDVPGKNGEKTGIKVKCEEDGNVCYVCNYTIAQDISTKTWITGMGDPEFLAYYEEFPKGPDVHWQFPVTNTWVTVGSSIALVGAINVVTGKMGVKVTKEQVVEGAKQIGKHYIEQGGKEATENTVKIVLKKTGIDGVDSVVKTGIFREALQEIDGISIKRAEYLRGVYEKYLREAAEKTTSKNINDIEKQALEKFNKNLDDILINPANYEGGNAQMFNGMGLDFSKEGDLVVKKFKDDVTKGLTESVGQKVTKATRLEFASDLSLSNAFKNLLETDGNAFSKQAIQDTLEKSFKQIDALSSLPESQQKQVIGAANKRLEKMFSKGGEFEPPGLFQRFDETFMGNNLDEAIESWDKDKMGTLMERISQTTGSVKDVAAQSAEYLPKSGWVGGPLMPMKFSLNPVTQTKQLSKWVWGKRYTLLLGTALLAAYQDRVEKYSPGGANSLFLGTPSALGTTRAEYTLAPEALKYYIVLHERFKGENKLRQNYETTRFYLASPCQTDLVIKKQSCHCMRHPYNWHFNFGGGPIDIEPATIQYRPKATDEQRAQLGTFFIDGDLSNIKSSDEKKSNAARLLNNPNLINDPSVKNTIDYDFAVKRCEERSFWQDVKFATGVESIVPIINPALPGGLQFVPMPTYGDDNYYEYQTDCISIEPVIRDDLAVNYCYARFPYSQAEKEAISSGVTLANIVFAFTGVGIPVAIALDTADILINSLITELWQKWPNSE